MRKLEVVDPALLKDKNPFTFSLKIEVSRIYDKKKYVSKEGEPTVPATFDIEKQRSTKIYHSKKARVAVGNLTGGAHKLLFHIIYSMEPGNDYVQVNTEHYMRLYGIKSIKTYNDSIKELKMAAFIGEAAPYKDVFYINPAFIFSGSRINAFKDKVTIKSEL